MPNDTKRIHILSHAEIEELYARPDFNAHEQRLYFSLTPSERNALAEFSKTKTRIFFILQLGYFKAKQQFFNFSLDDVSRDVQFIVDTYYPSSTAVFTGQVSRDYVRLQRQAILSLFNYENWSWACRLIKNRGLTDKNSQDEYRYRLLLPNNSAV